MLALLIGRRGPVLSLSRYSGAPERELEYYVPLRNGAELFTKNATIVFLGESTM